MEDRASSQLSPHLYEIVLRIRLAFSRFQLEYAYTCTRCLRAFAGAAPQNRKPVFAFRVLKCIHVSPTHNKHLSLKHDARGVWVRYCQRPDTTVRNQNVEFTRDRSGASLERQGVLAH